MQGYIIYIVLPESTKLKKPVLSVYNTLLLIKVDQKLSHDGFQLVKAQYYETLHREYTIWQILKWNKTAASLIALYN